jgi:hypothetical protein
LAGRWALFGCRWYWWSIQKCPIKTFIIIPPQPHITNIKPCCPYMRVDLWSCVSRIYDSQDSNIYPPIYETSCRIFCSQSYSCCIKVKLNGASSLDPFLPNFYYQKTWLGCVLPSLSTLSKDSDAINQFEVGSVVIADEMGWTYPSQVFW